MMHHLVQTLTSWRAPMKSITSDVLWTRIYNGLWAAIWILLVLASSALFPSLITGPCKIAWSSQMLCYLIANFHLCCPFLSSIWNLWHPTSSWKEGHSAEPYLSVCEMLGYEVKISETWWSCRFEAIISRHLLHSTNWGYGNQIPVIAGPPCDINYLRLACMIRFLKNIYFITKALAKVAGWPCPCPLTLICHQQSIHWIIPNRSYIQTSFKWIQSFVKLQLFRYYLIYKIE